MVFENCDPIMKATHDRRVKSVSKHVCESAGGYHVIHYSRPVKGCFFWHRLVYMAVARKTKTGGYSVTIQQINKIYL